MPLNVSLFNDVDTQKNKYNKINHLYFFKVYTCLIFVNICINWQQ